MAVVACSEAAGLPDNSLAVAAGRTTAKHATTRIHRRILALEVIFCMRVQNRKTELIALALDRNGGLMD